jgi:L-seryl-tRNA(Ser) seleniumtransferase
LLGAGSATVMSDPVNEGNLSLRILPSVDEFLSVEGTQDLIEKRGRRQVVEMVRSLLAEKREELARDPSDAQGSTEITRSALLEELVVKLEAVDEAQNRSGVRRVINATGVVIHTNLGRAPLSAQAAEAMAAAASYSTIEYDLDNGRRGLRGSKAISLLKRLTRAEDALVVNNCASAALLVLSVFARGGEVIVSRGELVEIGGDFRIPDILSASGATLREVGTTNRTHLHDYENAINERTAMVLKVHPSNFRITGFTTAPATKDLADLAHRHGIPLCEDAGSGAVEDLSRMGLTNEPVIGDLIEAGADIVIFSGDKLLGGPQSGIIVGRAEYISKLRKAPYFRAFRVDKAITAGLEATLEAHLRGKADNEIPVLRMLSISTEEMEKRSITFLDRLNALIGENAALKAALQTGRSAVGGGAAPDSDIRTTLISLSHSQMSEAELEERLRSTATPVISRIEDGRVLIDLRTVAESEEGELLETISKFS